MGAGKTTAIAAISEIAPVSTDVANTDRLSNAKATTTTALDYGEVTLPTGDKLRLYGTPGQARFDFMWKIIGEGALGVVVLVDNSQPDPLKDLRDYLIAFRETASSSRAVIGVGRTELHPTPTLDSFHAVTRELGLSAPILSVDVRRREDVLLLLDVLFHQIEAAETLGQSSQEGTSET
jgi:signal recognition particle receptor subunit beta